MRISLLTIGAIASIITTAAFANQVITSQTYVDNQDALKVNIAQGTGTNNANVGKTLVVNSQGNLELGAPAAGNYVEDSITDGVTNKAPSENAVHDALANKQNTIPATGTNSSTPGTTVVTYTGTAGQIGERGIFNPATDFDFRNNEIADGHEGDLVTADIYQGVVEIHNQIQEIQNDMPDFDDLPTKTVTHRTCTRWIDGQSHTDANCLLWNLVDETVYGAQCNVDADCAGYIGNCSCVNHMCDCVIDSQ